MNNLGKFTLMLLSQVLKGFAFVVLWGWFVSGWFSIKPITIPESLGITLIISFLTGQLSAYTKDERSFVAEMVYAFIVPLVALVFGLIYHMFM